MIAPAGRRPRSLTGRAADLPAAALVLLLAMGAACAGGDPAANAPAGAPPAPPPDAAAPAGHDHAAAPGGPHDATTHHGFEDADSWVKVFDAPDRDTWQKPGEVIDGLEIKTGMIVADLGAGTGYFESPLSKAVGPAGLVLAIDPEPEMVNHLGRRARTEGLPNVLPVLGLPDEPFLPRGRVDRVLIVDTYHHIDDRLAYFGRLRESLAPGGRVAIVDFHKRPLPVGPPPEHKLERQAVVDEMEQSGWRLASEKTTLPYQYFLVFEPRVDSTAGAVR